MQGAEKLLGELFFSEEKRVFLTEVKSAVVTWGREGSLSHEKPITTFMDDPISDDFAYAFTLSPLHLRH